MLLSCPIDPDICIHPFNVMDGIAAYGYVLLKRMVEINSSDYGSWVIWWYEQVSHVANRVTCMKNPFFRAERMTNSPT